MKNVSKRRGIDGAKKGSTLWLNVWDKLYLIVSISTYIMALISLIVTVYHVLIVFEPIKALSTGLLALLMAKMNQMNP